MRFKKMAYTAILAAAMLCSCSSTKKIPYFQDLTPTETIALQQCEALKLRPFDRLSIVVSTGDSRLNALFNLQVARHSLNSGAFNGSSNGNNGDGSVQPYTINSKGFIDFPILGKLHIAGMTREEVGEYIRTELVERDLAKNPIVTVEYLNLGVTVLGDVGRPGRVNIDRDDYTILDAIAASGDLTLMARRDNIMVVRDDNGTQRVYTIDITKDKELTQSPVYYLKQKDIIYVEPIDTKKRSTDPNGNTWLTPSFWMSVTTFLISLSTLLFIRK